MGGRCRGGGVGKMVSGVGWSGKRMNVVVGNGWVGGVGGVGVSGMGWVDE